MIGKFAGAMLGRRLARRAGHSGLLGAAAGIGVSILAHRFAPKLGRVAFQQGIRLLQPRRALHMEDDDAQTAGA